MSSSPFYLLPNRKSTKPNRNHIGSSWFDSFRHFVWKPNQIKPYVSFSFRTEPNWPYPPLENKIEKKKLKKKKGKTPRTRKQRRDRGNLRAFCSTARVPLAPSLPPPNPSALSLSLQSSISLRSDPQDLKSTSLYPPFKNLGFYSNSLTHHGWPAQSLTLFSLAPNPRTKIYPKGVRN